ncbi:ABC transporter ATP-binding protein [Rhodoblastus acidophilus]|uniref:ABC transporter ATP-binding protein n=1 Tax=Candidatus Rhodoblastus alkanivorans TaxID=2954117 RepID=A0ABS9Z116_9HYPH|nr:ABC transporter ATP-binding protein [Candidatus Rhodoblastus alkanivorans]MCI4678558.1 ABC transporter ATP-binding protein [Candidatus Rhodoblastus alkanivorans]MCI4681354.1 ABC transporter ATP-binding protein [Candidatus Rhodoblastus alkanivorans]MDI4642402.1 ABC transporter ATP-binding protein [Rhodoblastus acidophilus]
MVDPAIRLENVNLALGSGEARTQILKDICLNVAPGETLALLGPSGSGKSTLLMTMAGLEAPDSGAIWIAGRRLDQVGEDDLARFRGAHIGVVFQAFHLIQTLTALENVAIPLELNGVPDAFPRARKALTQVGLEGRVKHYPAQMSGGEQQRVALARALVARPALLLADEPTGNLDQSVGAEIIELIFALNRAQGATLALVTHDEALARRCDRIVRLRNGRIESDSASVADRAHADA